VLGLSGDPPPFRCLSVPLDGGLLHAYRDELSIQALEDALDGLAEAIASTPGFPTCTVLCRPSPEPVLSLWGELTEGEFSRLTAQAASLAGTLRRLRYVEGPEVEALCERLAGALRDRLGGDRLAGARFVALPRGGIRVLAMLAYLLDLDREQLAPGLEEAGTVVVVDDVAHTGHRFGKFLAGLPAREVVFAHLLSSPGLRRAVEAREPRVSVCVAASDLEEPEDAAPDSDREGLAARLDPPRYLVAPSVHVAFPWSEPDTTCLDPATGAAIVGWRVVPPSLCLANRVRRERPGGSRVRRQPEGGGPLRPSARALFLDADDRVLVADRETGEILALEGAGAEIWNAIVALGSTEAVRERLRAAYGAPEERLRADLGALVEELTARGLLEVADARS
jgi:hypothetical protein